MPRMHLNPPKSIMVADNDQNQRHSLALILRHAGYLVSTVDRACDALDSLLARHCDMVILDITMPDIRFTLLPAIMRLYPGLPILAFTAEWSPETAVEIAQLGVCDHLEKPIKPKCVLDHVEKILLERDHE